MRLARRRAHDDADARPARLQIRTVSFSLGVRSWSCAGTPSDELFSPPPLLLRWPESTFDYDLVNPLGGARPYPCGGKPAGQKTATLTAGKRLAVKLEGSATHHGGHCQFAVSYDQGKTFVVLLTVRSNCMVNSLSYSVPIPANLPACANCICE